MRCRCSLCRDVVAFAVAPSVWQREPELDTRFARGDDFASDAWRNVQTGELRRVIPGHRPD